LTVGQSLPLERLDTFLRAKFPAVSRGAIQRLLEQGRIRVNGRAAKPAHHPRAGETISVRWPEARADRALPEDIPLDILHEDDDLLVLNKPPGLVVHPAAGHPEHTLVNALLHHCAGRLSGIGGVARPGIVHRLDKETSGCLIVAKNDAAHLKLRPDAAGRGRDYRLHRPPPGPAQAHGGHPERRTPGAHQLSGAGTIEGRGAG
jgi:23S rRNA pseudouridine1911/1915/1917 synthase